MKTIRTVSAGCGTGKTHSVCKHVKSNRAARNSLYVSQTIQLVTQTANQLRGFGVDVKEIHSGNSQHPKGEIIEFLRSAEDSGHVLLITWASYSQLRYFDRKENWDIYIDEIPQVDKFHKLRVPYNHDLITQYLQIETSINETIGIVVPNDREKLRYFVENVAKKDDVYLIYMPLLMDVLSDNKDVYVDLKSWAKICEFNDPGEKDIDNFVYFISLLNPKLFESTTLLGANIEFSMLYDWLAKYPEVRFCSHDKIVSKLIEPNYVGDRLKITYFIQGRSFSKGLRDKIHKNKPVIEVMESSIKKMIGDEQFLLISNNDYEGGLDKLPNCKRIAVDSKGMNEYQSFTNIVHLPALNREPKHSWMLGQLGFNSETIRVSTSYEVLYQNVMRTALRDAKSDAVVFLYVPTEFEADFLIEQFGDGVAKRMVGDVDFKPYMPLTNSERNHKSKVNKRLDELQPSTHGVDQVPVFSDDLSIDKNKSHQKPANQISDASDSALPQSGWLLTFCHDEYATYQEDFHLEYYKEIKDLVKDLRHWSKNPIKQKTDSRLMINPVIYRVDAAGKYRSQKNFQHSSMMILDFDSGQLSPEEFIKIFWEKAGKGQKRSFILTNSFSRSMNNPNRFRVFMIYKKPAKFYEEHVAVFDSIVAKLESYGYTPESTGLDVASRNGVQPFHIPCTNRAHPDGRLFVTKGIETREIERYGIDPSTYLRTFASTPKRSVVVPMDDNGSHGYSEAVLQEKIEEIKDRVRVLKEGRRIPFFKAGLAMKGLGVDVRLIKQHLNSLEHEIGKSGSGWVQATIDSLTK